MDDNQKFHFDACMKQAEYFRSNFDQRRQYEWKVTIGIWTSLIGGIIFIKKPFSVPYVLMALLIFGYGYFWLRPLWRANNGDKQKARFFQNQADTIMRDPSFTLTEPPAEDPNHWYNLTFLLDWSMLFQLVSTFVLAILFYVVER